MTEAKKKPPKKKKPAPKTGKGAGVVNGKPVDVPSGKTEPEELPAIVSTPAEVEKKETTAVATVPQGSGSLITGEDYGVALEREKAYRGHLTKYIREELISDKDYGVIKNKPCLLKPGAEKINNLLNLQANFSKDDETLDMITEEIKTQEGGILAYKCELYNRTTGLKVSEGRGACTIREKGGNINTAIKISEKRAMIDAVLRLGLSDAYTQDLDDMYEVSVGNNSGNSNKSGKKAPPPKKDNRNKGTDPSKYSTAELIGKIRIVANMLSVMPEELAKAVDDVENLSRDGVLALGAELKALLESQKKQEEKNGTGSQEDGI
jgi:hypothetical protein